MKISLIDNGLDSLRKGFEFLKKYEDLKNDGESDAKRFSALKDAVLAIQHGIEILFKFLLKDKNEILLYSDINAKLKSAYKSKRRGEIAELFEAEGVHTVTYRESIDRVNDILGIEVGERLQKTLLKIEKWRNSITHSSVLLNESEVSNVLFDAMIRLDEFFGPAIGAPYQTGQGRQALDRAYRLFKVTHGAHDSDIKAGVIERLILALSENGIKNVTSPGVFTIKDASIAFSILQSMQGDSAKYGCDMINMHCSGETLVTGRKGVEITLASRDNRADYRFDFSGLLIYVPDVKDEYSPLVFLYSLLSRPFGSNPKIRDFSGFKTQEGILLTDSGEEIWDKSEIDEFHYDDEESRSRPPYRGIFKFLSQGMMCYLNIQNLSHGRGAEFLYEKKFNNIDDLDDLFQSYIADLEKRRH